MGFDQLVEGRIVRIAGAASERTRFGLRNRLRAVFEEAADDAHARRLELGARDDFVHEPDASRLLGAEPLAGERIAAQLTHADGVGELRNDDGRRQSPPHLGDREDRVIRRDRDIAGRDDAGPAAEAAAVNERHGGHRHAIEPPHGLRGSSRHADILLRR